MGQMIAAERLEDRYFLQKVKLGKGAFGVVTRAVNRRTNQVVAVKQIDKAHMRKVGISRADMEQEVKVMQVCDHPNILRIFDHFEDNECISLALEYCDGGDFGDKVKEKAKSLEEHEAAEWTRQICGAIQALHSKNICHRDVKPDNFMVLGSDPGVLKLSDFGLAKFLLDGERLTQKSGTPAFMAPELHRLPNQSQGYSFEVDMWAAGVLLYSLLNGGRHPFVDSRGNFDTSALLKGTLDFSSQKSPMADLVPWLQKSPCSQAAENLCRQMVTPHAGARATAQEALASPWLRQFPRLAQPKPEAFPWIPRESPNSASTCDKENVVQRNSDLAAKLEDHEAALEVSRQRERILLDMVGEKGHKAPTTLCVPRSGAQGRLPQGMKCRYWSSSQRSWLKACVVSCNEADGTYDLDIRAGAALPNISPRSDVKAEEAWPRGTFVSYRSATSGKEVPAVIISLQMEKSGHCTYNLDVRDCAELDRIRPRLMLDARR